MVKTDRREFVAGDVVEIEWGPTRVRGKVILIYGDKGNRHFVVDVPRHDARGNIIASSTASVREADVTGVQPDP